MTPEESIMPSNDPAPEIPESVRDHQYLEFVDLGTTPSGLTRRWSIRSRGAVNYLGMPIVLGEVSWWAPWRQYTLKPTDNTIWNKDCLTTVAGFCDSMTEDHRIRRLLRTDAT